jgi:hypothetical protein
VVVVRLSCYFHIGLAHSDETEAAPVHRTLMMEIKQVAETLDFDADMMRLIARERCMEHSLLRMFIRVGLLSIKA